MPLEAPFPGHTGLTNFSDLRRDLEGLVVRNSAGAMRAGIFPDHLNAIVTGRADMKVNIASFRGVQDRGGAVLLANVGTDTSVQLAAAPAANRRIDLIYVTMRSTDLGDPASTPIFGVVQGTASPTPTVPALPSNLADALKLATVEIPAGATTTLSPGVIVSQIYPYTAMAGGTVVVRNAVELAAWTPADSARAYMISDAREYVRQGGTWVKGAGPQTAWESLRTVLSLPGTWTDGSGTPAQIRLNAGNVEIRGILENANAFSLALLGTLPLHYRPGQRITRNAESSLQPTIRKAIRVETNGQVFVNSPTSGTAQWWLDGITWSPDT